MPDARETTTAAAPEAEALGGRDVARILAELGGHACFGPRFFLEQLGGLVRDRCPAPAEELPIVQLHMFGGEVLDVCHVIGLTPVWVALAVYDKPWSSGARVMRTDLVPYQAILRVTIRSAPAGSHRIGFDRDHSPALLGPGGDEACPSAEDLLKTAASARILRERPPIP